jgi:GDP-D-mannose dehydratase
MNPYSWEIFCDLKITRAASCNALGLQDKFYLGNPDAKCDWGHAKDYVMNDVDDLYARRSGGTGSLLQVTLHLCVTCTYGI